MHYLNDFKVRKLRREMSIYVQLYISNQRILLIGSCIYILGQGEYINSQRILLIDSCIYILGQRKYENRHRIFF